MVVRVNDGAMPWDCEPLFDRQALLDHYGGDLAVFDEMIGLFINDGDDRRARIVAALDGRDADALRRQAHGLRGALGVLAGYPRNSVRRNPSRARAAQ